MMLLRDIVAEVSMRSKVSFKLPQLRITMQDIQVKHHQDITNHQFILLFKLQITHLKVDTLLRVNILLKVIHCSQAQKDLLELHQEGIQVLLQVILKLHIRAIQEPNLKLKD